MEAVNTNMKRLFAGALVVTSSLRLSLALQLLCSEQSLPSPVRRLLSPELPGWRVTALQDLTPDDQEVWSKARGSACPGLLEGRFESAGRGYAIMLMRKDRGKFQQTLVVGVDKGGSWAFRILDGPSGVRVPLVITKWPPGKYESTDKGRQATTDFEVIQEEQIAASAAIFYWKDGKFRYMRALE
jgi:hypothetical protein